MIFFFTLLYYEIDENVLLCAILRQQQYGIFIENFYGTKEKFATDCGENTQSLEYEFHKNLMKCRLINVDFHGRLVIG